VLQGRARAQGGRTTGDTARGGMQQRVRHLQPMLPSSPPGRGSTGIQPSRKNLCLAGLTQTLQPETTRDLHPGDLGDSSRAAYHTKTLLEGGREFFASKTKRQRGGWQDRGRRGLPVGRAQGSSAGRRSRLLQRSGWTRLCCCCAARIALLWGLCACWGRRLLGCA
jgi:hypothetical protein